uniref:Uncharacterized protein n=1 Tax=uncultured bacterium A1Q1_fos_499 TaxID=1256578 RepID=L7W1M4_9BACT|nr:hypothetical protein [uncultured bacterium A1Q1_fos_499]
MPVNRTCLTRSFAALMPAVVAVVLGGSVPGAAARAQLLPLEVVVDETRPVFGEEVQIVVRTVESRPLSSATFGLEMRDEDGLPAVLFSALDSAAVFAGSAGGAGDATIQTQWNPVTQRVDVTLESASATLNEVFGPLAVLRFTLDPVVATLDRPRFEIALDPDMILLDAAAERVVTLPANGRVRVVDADPAQGLGALGGEVFPGGNMVIGAMTVHTYAIGSGTLELLYDAALADGPPVVALDLRYGATVVDALDTSVAGRVLVTFHSDGGLFNATLHGAIFTAVVPSRQDIPIGTTSIVALGPATALFDAAGDPIDLETDVEQLDFIAPEAVAAAAFEGGGFTEWWNVVH